VPVGVINQTGAQIAEDGGVTVVMDRCIKVEHARYVGRMHWLGFNTNASPRSGPDSSSRHAKAARVMCCVPWTGTT
jgi:hypothetical protein